MFTIKAYKFYDEGTSTCYVYSCKFYQVYQREEGNYEISMYPELSKTDGVCINVSDHENEFNVVYIENSVGKTIDTLRRKDYMTNKA